MTVSVARLLEALRAQSAELNAPALAGTEAAAAQQLRYHSSIDSNLGSLRPITEARLAELAATRRVLGLVTRWSTGRVRNRVVTGHSEVTAMAVAPDGSFLVYATADHVVSRKSLVAATAAPEILGMTDHWVTAVAMGPHGRSFVTGDRSGAVLRWTFADDSGSGARKDVLGRHGTYVHAVVGDRDSEVVFSCDDEGVVARSDQDGFHPIVRLTRSCLSLALDARAGALYTGDAGGEIRRWSPTGEGGTLVASQPGPVVALAATPASGILSTAWDGVLRIWEPEPRVIGRAGSALAGKLALDGDRVVAADIFGTVLTWRLDETEAEPAVLGAHDWGARAVGAAAGVVVTGARDGFILRWDSADQPARPPLAAPGVEIRAMAVARDGSAVVTGGGNGVHRWALSEAKRAPRSQQVWQHPVIDLDLLDSGEIVACDDKGAILLGDPAQPGEPRVIAARAEDREAAVRQLVAVPRARAVVTAMEDGRILHRDLDRPEEVRLVGFDKACAIAVAPDGAWVASVGHARIVKRWNLHAPSEPVSLGWVSSRARALTVTADGAWVITGDDHGEIRKCETTGIDTRAVLIGRHLANGDAQTPHTRVRSVAVPEGGTWIASVADDGTVRCWNNSSADSSTALIPAALPRLAAPVGERLLIAARHGALTLLDVVGAVAPGAREDRTRVTGLFGPAEARVVDRTLILDQVWCNRVRARKRLDLEALRDGLSGSVVTEALVPCPDIAVLRGFRTFLSASGWTIVDVPMGQVVQQRRVVELAIDAAARNEVTVVSGDPAVVDALSAARNSARITIVDDVRPWLGE